MNVSVQAPRRSEDLGVTVRAPGELRMRLTRLPAYWPLIRVLATRDIKARYKQSALGPAWVLFQPLALLLAFAVGFRAVASVGTGGVPYAVFVLAALPVWSYFQVSSMASAGTLLNNYSLVRWTACPRISLPLATLVANAPTLVITFLAGVVATLAAGYASPRLLLLPVMLVWLFMIVSSSALVLSALTVRARDVVNVLPFLLQILTFVSPIGYPTSALPHKLQTFVALNPLTGLMDFWRWSLLGIHPELLPLAVAIGETLVLVPFAWRFFARLEAVMADEI